MHFVTMRSAIDKINVRCGKILIRNGYDEMYQVMRCISQVGLKLSSEWLNVFSYLFFIIIYRVVTLLVY